MDGTASSATTNHTNCHSALNRTNNNHSDNKQDNNNENDSDNVSHYDDDDDDDANTPYLLSHLEVYELLQPRVQLVRRHRKHAPPTTATTITHRHETTSSAAVTTLPTTTTTLERTRTSDQIRKPKRPRHLHWIENQVVQYIQEHTAALEFQSTQHSLPLRSILLRRKRPTRASGVAATTNDTAVAASIHPDTTTTTRLGFHLTEAEMIQILNHSPKEMVDLHLYIDQIHERLTMTEQEELLQIIAQCRRPRDSSSSSSNTPLVPSTKTTTPVHNGAVTTTTTTTNGNIKLED